MVDVEELSFWFYVQNFGFIDEVTAFARAHKVNNYICMPESREVYRDNRDLL